MCRGGVAGRWLGLLLPAAAAAGGDVTSRWADVGARAADVRCFSSCARESRLRKPPQPSEPAAGPGWCRCGMTVVGGGGGFESRPSGALAGGAAPSGVPRACAAAASAVAAAEVAAAATAVGTSSEVVRTRASADRSRR